MARFQALTNSVLEAELDMLRKRLGLEPSQRADLLREVAALAAWVVRQSEQGRFIEARKGQVVEPLVHPAIDRLRARRTRSLATSIALNDSEVRSLSGVLDRGYHPSPGLRLVLANLAHRERRPPKLRWKKSAG